MLVINLFILSISISIVIFSIRNNNEIHQIIAFLSGVMPLFVYLFLPLLLSRVYWEYYFLL